MQKETIQENRILLAAAAVLERRAGLFAYLATQLIAVVHGPVEPSTHRSSQPNLQRSAAAPAADGSTASRVRRAPHGRRQPGNHPWRTAPAAASPVPSVIAAEPDPATPQPVEPAASPAQIPTPAPVPAAKPVAFLTKEDLAKTAAAAAAPLHAPPEAPTFTPRGAGNRNLDRDQQIVDIVKAHPGVHMSQIRLWLREGKRGELINPGTLHHVLNRLISEKRILRDAGGYHPVTAADRN